MYNAPYNKGPVYVRPASYAKKISGTGFTKLS